MTAPVRTCESCGQEIARSPKWSHANYATRRYCDRTCQYAARPDIATDYTVTDAGCWQWNGHIDRNGYGKAYDASRPRGRRVDWAHRVSYRNHRGEIPKGLTLDHLCANTVCINPDHLEPVTYAENTRRALTRAGKDDLHSKAARLREEGLTYGQIAEALLLTSRAGAASAVESAIRKGLVDPGALPEVRRLADGDRDDIRALYALGIPQTEIGAWYRVDSSQVSRICNGATSGHSVRRLAA